MKNKKIIGWILVILTFMVLIATACAASIVCAVSKNLVGVIIWLFFTMVFSFIAGMLILYVNLKTSSKKEILEFLEIEDEENR